MNQSKQEYAESYGEGCAEFYDEIYGAVSQNMIAALCGLAGGGRVLELGVGTGRVALPLAARGADICGIEASPAMISKLRDKPGGRETPVIKGNFATVQPKGSFSLILTLVSTFFLLRSRNEQQCFHSVSRLLPERGIFLIETFKPIGAIEMARNGQDGSLEKTYTVEQVLDKEIGLR
jgi:cyclopropane fatty-acyl-phospholipid synthase-like methyltransferase